MKRIHCSARTFLANNLVAVIFLVLTMVSIPLSGFSASYIVNEILSRIGRNAFLVFSLILPIMAGMGINFGMVLGAMAGQIGLIFAMDWNLAGIQALVFAALVGMPISVLLVTVLLYWFTGISLNITLPGARTTAGSTNKLLGIVISPPYYFANKVVNCSKFLHSSCKKREAGVPSIARWS